LVDSAPEPSPFLIAALLIIALVGGVVAFTGSDGWANLSTEAVNYVQPGRDLLKANSPSPPRADVSHVRDQSTVSRVSASAKDAPREQNLRKSQNTNSANKNKTGKNSRGR
jgi:hypothetical protein